MPTYTLIENGELSTIISCSESKRLNYMSESQPYIQGAWPRTEFELVNGEPVARAELPPDVQQLQQQAERNKQQRFKNSLLAAGWAADDMLPPPDDWTKADAKNAIDQAAGRARVRAVSQGALVEEEYRLAKTQADAWNGTGTAPPAIQSWAEASGMTPTEAQADIQATAQLWEGVLQTVRQIRLDGKAAVNAATEGQQATTAQPYIDQLNAIGNP